MALFEPKLTKEQRQEIFNRALDGEQTKVLAKEFNVCNKTIAKIKYDPKLLDQAEKRIDRHQKFARLRIHKAAMKGVEKEHEILDREVPEGEKGTSLLYLQHQVASSMMDRDGLKAPEKNESKIEIVFGDGDESSVPLGMPSDTTSVEEEAVEEGDEE